MRPRTSGAVLAIAMALGAAPSARAADPIFSQGVLHGAIFNNKPAAHDLQVTFFGIYDHVKILITAIFFTQQCFEYIFNHFHHSGAVNIFCFLKILESVDEVNACHIL